MGTKTISIMDDVHRLLVARKKEHESFSDVIRRVVKEKRDIMEFAGAWKHLSDGEIDAMKKIIKKIKKDATGALKRSYDSFGF